MNFTRNNSTSAIAKNKNISWHNNSKNSDKSSWRDRNSNTIRNRNRNYSTTNRKRNNSTTNRNSNKINQFKSAAQHAPCADVNNLLLFPKLSEKEIIQPKKESVNTAFLDKARQRDDIKDKEEEETGDFVSNLPMGWVRLSQTNPSKPTDKEIQFNKARENFEKKQKLVKGIWSSLRHIQKQRDELNEVLGSNSPYYNSYNILGPPGESEDDDDEYDYDYSSDEKTEDDDYM